MPQKMGHAAFSLYCFAFYLIIIGMLFLIFPEILHNIAEIGDVNIMSRVFGQIILYLAYYYFRVSKKDVGMETFFLGTVHTRATAIIILMVFYALGWAEILIALFGLGDFAGAMWTYWGLKKDARERRSLSGV
jgi:hypothetical protein